MSHIVGANGAMRRVHPGRMHSQGYRPKPLPKGNALYRFLKWLTTPAEPKHRAAFLNDNDMGL